MIGNRGVHLVAQILQLADGQVSDIRSDVNHWLNPGDAEDDLVAFMRGPDGTEPIVEPESARKTYAVLDAIRRGTGF